MNTAKNSAKSGKRCPPSAAVEVSDLNGGGPFAPLWVAPAVAPSTPTPEPRTGIALASLGALAMIAAACSFAIVSRAPGRVTPQPNASVEAPATATTEVSPAPIATITKTDEAMPAAVGSVKLRAKTRVAPPASSVVPTSVPTTAPSAPATAPKVVPKCCSGETEMACHMRIAVGGSCG